MSDSPSAMIVSNANKKTIITDANGRKLTLRQLNVLDQLRMFKAIGAEQSNNKIYVSLVQCAVSVASIDDVPQPMPTNEKQIEAIVAKLGDEGFVAISAHIQKQISEIEAAAEAAANSSSEESTATSPLQV